MKIKILTLLIIIFWCFGLQAKSLKINYKTQVSPISIVIEKAEFRDNQTNISVKVKQKRNFSYNISLSDIYIVTSNNTDPIKGKLSSWNDVKNPTPDNKPVRDDSEEKFILSFPGDIFKDVASFDIKIGTILDREKRELIFHDILLSK